MKFRFLLLVAAAWLALPLAPSFADTPSFAETRAKAEHGEAEAQFNLGLAYYNGKGVPQNVAEAVKWWRKAAAQGQVKAQFDLGSVFYAGLSGVPQNHAEAAKWWRKAAEQGFATAQSNLGILYADGDGVTQDGVEAAKWFLLASAQDDDKGKDLLDTLAGVTPAQIEEARKRAAAWKPHSN